MKFVCECGNKILDIADGLSYKAHIIADQDWFELLDEIDNAIEKSGPTEKDKENAVMQIRMHISKLAKTLYQCQNCGNIFLAKKNTDQLEMFKSFNENTDKNLLNSSK
jgi:DNA-directed RNA polymerase subunit RPC12/RpoP